MKTWGLSLGIAIALLGACNSQQDTEVGSLRMPLRGSAPSGNVYQLNGALFTVTDGMTTVATLDSDADPAATVLSADLPVGGYLIELTSGWSMIDVGTGLPVSATLVSPAAQMFAISDDTTTTVAYQFRVNGEVTVMGGTLEVVLDITEGPTCSGDPRADALAECAARFGANCGDTGTSIIGWADGLGQGSNCNVGQEQWLQFCYADAYDTYNCNTCEQGAIKLAHDPCECGENTATIGTLCSGGGATAVTYSQAFVGGVASLAGGPECGAWNMFTASIAAGDTYSRVTIRNTDGATASCNGPLADTLCHALNTGAEVPPTDCDGLVWAAGSCGGPEISANGGVCSCTDGFVVRPCVGNENWGGAGTATCLGPSQTLEVICE